MKKLNQKPTIRPLGDRVLLRQLAAPSITAGGILLPEKAREKPREAIVIAVGPGHRMPEGMRPLDVKVGDKVMFGAYGGTEVEHQGSPYILIQECDILGIVESD